MKNILISILSIILIASIVQAAGFSKEAKFRSYKVLISSEKPLSAGSNLLVLEISKDGTLAKDARVSVKAFMPAMPGMPAMETTVDAKALGDGKYEAPLNLSMGGTWQLHIFITPSQGKKARIKSSLNF